MSGLSRSPSPSDRTSSHRRSSQQSSRSPTHPTLIFNGNISEIMAETLGELKKKRTTIKAQLTRTQNKIVNFNVETDDKGEVEARLQKIYELWDSFDITQTRIESLDETQVHERDIFEDTYFQIVAVAKRIIAPPPPPPAVANLPLGGRQVGQEQNAGDLGPTSNVKLPTISIPKFDGNYSHWLPFRDGFETLVDKNESLNNLQKFYYLKSQLQGVASQVIHSLETTADNYPQAWSLLKTRFENKRLLVRHHIQALFDIVPIAKESAMHLRKLIDDTLKHLRALKTLGQPTDQWDSLIIYMIAARLDPVTRRKWEMSITTQDTPTFEDLNVFLTQHCAVLETLNPPKQPSSKPGKSFNANKKYEESVSCISSKNEGESKSYEKKACPSCGRDHSIYHCSKFKELTTQEKWNEVKRVRVCFNCLRSDHTSDKCRSSSCRKCNKKHNTLLHIDEFYPRSNENCDEQPNLSQTNRTNEQTNVSLSSVQQNKSLAMLSTALVTIYDKFGNARVCRAVLDSGSQSNLLTKELCERLQLPKSNVSVSLTGVSLSQSHVNGSVNATIKSRSNEFKAKLPFLIIERITQNLPTAKLDVQRFKIPENITLADPSFNIPGKIDLLLGAGIFWQLLCVGQHVISRSQPILHKTKLGWVVGGNIALPETQNEDTRATLCCFTTDTSLHDQVEQFWRIEEYTPSRKFSEEERSCEDDFKANYRRDETGRFTVSLSFRSSPDQLGESREIALRRLQAINRKLDRQPELKILYEKFMNEYLALGHMSEVHDDKNQNHAHRYYIPHHAVFKESSRTSKLRVVFDASCKSASGKSLNDILRVGPTIQQELFAIVARFRQHRYVVTADIEKMYRQVNIQNDHRDLQRILWRANADAPVKEYRLNTVTYGTATAPFLAIRSLQQIAHDNEGNHPELSEIILRDFYVDDLLTGGDDIEHVKFIKDGVTELLLSGGFPLRKWTSNAPGIVDTSNDTRQGGDLPIGDEIKTLGLLWSPERDSLRYKVITRDTRSTVTKRNVLSLISQIYDPLGLVGPACIKAKIILQQLWRLKIGWDESLPSDLHTTWRQYYDQLPTINDISIPRAIVCIDPVRVELHGFCDASESAYGACIYTKSITSENETVVKLLCAKSRVAPLKSVTLPRLELCGALLLAKLAQRVTEALTLSFDAEYYWSDSQIALCWIKGEACTWKTFVSNRVAEIQELTDLRYWHHVRSEDNPADVISRGISSEQLHDCHIWWNGPQWLNQSTDDYLADTNEELYDETSSVVLNEAKRSTAILATAINEFEILERYSSMRTLTRVVAYCQRFIYNRLHPQEHKIGSLSVHELNQAMTALLKICQRQSFPQELQDLRSKRSIQKHSKLGSLHPFIDDDGLIRVGGRLQNARLLYAQKFPVVLAPNNAFTKLLIRDTHVKGLHAGLQALLSLLGENYWILSARSTVRNVLHKCLTCYRMRPKNLEQIMGNLPSVRVNPGRAFLNAGVDYGGPFNIKISRNKSAKAYLCLFVCLATRAVHLELVSDLSTTAFLNSLKRFIARRGKPSNIYSDNGSNFVGANNELKGLATLRQNAKHQSDVINFSADRVIQWHFIPPYSPHMGGIWEAGIKSAKTHLKRVLSDALLTFEEFYTIITEIEACLNSRPISPMSSDPSDLNVLTPGHFLIGAPLTAIPQPDLQVLATNRLTRYQLLMKLQQHFWSRWSHEYLTQLQSRAKWKDVNVNELLKPDTLVILKDDKLPPLQWKLGRVTETHAGKDGHVRVVSVKTCNGIVQRSLPKICIVPT